ncbi:MAG: GIY-YIG nuclease family protein, partial [Shimia sp.]
RSWSQWVHSQNKRILEWRRTSLEPPFPGFAAFSARIGELATLPRTWRAALSASGGVYLLVSDTGAHYVGSASGEDGFWGRWQAYAANGHGGNVLLQAAGQKDYTVSVLETAGNTATLPEIIARESAWKRKLGTRATGLNAN